MLKANATLTTAATVLITNYQERMATLKATTEIALNAHVTGFMTELRATYPQFQFFFWGDNIKVYDPSIPVSGYVDDDSDLIMVVDRFTELDSDQREVGMTAAMVDFLNELGELEFAMGSVDFELLDNYHN